jgi:hypothetical protein
VSAVTNGLIPEAPVWMMLGLGLVLHRVIVALRST